METEAMGKVLVTARIESLNDLYEVEKGRLAPDDVRGVDVSDALVDTGSTLLSLPSKFIDQLGLQRRRRRRVRTTAGVVDASVCDAVRLTIQGRDTTVDVLEIPDDCNVLIGQIPLDGLDFVVDLTGQRLIGNPDHGGEHMAEIL